MKKEYVYVILILACITLTVSCGQKSSDNVVSSFNLNTKSVSTTEKESTGTFVEYNDGLLYCVDHNVKLLNFSDGRSRVICTDPSCNHKDTSCVAWVGDTYLGGYAGYCDGFFYYVVSQRETGTLDLVSLSTDDFTRKTIHSFNYNNYISGSKVYRISRISYTENGLAIIECNVAEVPSSGNKNALYTNLNFTHSILLMDLSSGNVLDEIQGSEVFAVYSDYVLLQQYRYSFDRMTFEEYEKENNSSFDSYDAYLEWYYNGCEVKKETAIYRISDGHTTTVKFAKSKYQRDEFDSYQVDFTYYILGYIDGNIYYALETGGSIEDRTFTVDICRIDIDSLDDTIVYSIDGGSPLITSYSDFDCIVDDGKLFYVLYDDSKEYGHVCTLDLNSLVSEEIYTDVWNVKYRIVGETDDSFIIDLNHNTGIFYRILKMDYYHGDFSQMVKYRLY